MRPINWNIVREGTAVVKMSNKSTFLKQLAFYWNRSRLLSATLTLALELPCSCAKEQS